jgi:hypothetical protein
LKHQKGNVNLQPNFFNGGLVKYIFQIGMTGIDHHQHIDGVFDDKGVDGLGYVSSFFLVKFNLVITEGGFQKVFVVLLP